MAEEEAAVAGGQGLVEGNQCIAPSVSRHVSPAAAAPFSSRGVDFPRKRRGSDLDPPQMLFFPRKEAHSQTEKRRRDKMNGLIEELSAMIPLCGPMARKLDKLTVLRMAVQHLQSLKGLTNSYVDGNYRPSFIQDSELRHLILQATLTGQSLFDFLHPKDVAKVKEQLSSPDVSPRDKLIDAKTGLRGPRSFHTGRTRVCSGSRRSFFCRMRSCKLAIKEEHGPMPKPKRKDHRRFCTIHCTGYLRTWPPDIFGMEVERDPKEDRSHFTCLVAVGRLHPCAVPQSSAGVKVRPTEFVTRFAMNGKFVYVDQRATAVLGYLPQELLGTSCYEYFHQDDHGDLTDKHRAVLQSKEKIFTDPYKFRGKDGSFVTLKSQWFSFTNPWTKELEYIVSVNTLVLGCSDTGEASLFPRSCQSSEESCRQSGVGVPGRSPGIVPGAGSIGTDTANEGLGVHRLQSSPSLDDSSPADVMRERHAVPCGDVSEEFCPLSPGGSGLQAARHHRHMAAVHSQEPLLSDGAQLDFDSLCDNDDTTVAAFMNYLEAEGGLGGSGDFSDIQWTL
ncbi:basic helix-loop-helix ARNT-like protein 2 isoform X4 [Lepus europaeus]|uniref:basic helix-loop-helix ARNT-like protein 2 isoform X4 n=1 Tax=Lepus europaeus TaxID=9983 RepID=UPI002B47BDDD|nr:basic helix-loop-helix ARNT-like protein 2 isoform X4 [Lepus europaeus]